MIATINMQMQRIYAWFGSHVHGIHAHKVLAALCFAEYFIFFPSDAFLAIYCVERKDKAYSFATIATISAVIGGLASYTMGIFLWKYAGQQIIHSSVLNWILSPENFFYLSSQFQKFQWLALIIAAFTPIPFKAVTLTAGFCNLPLLPFVSGTILARGLRFFAVAFTITSFGNYMQSPFGKYLKVILMKLTLVAVITFFWYIKK